MTGKEMGKISKSSFIIHDFCKEQSLSFKRNDVAFSSSSFNTSFSVEMTHAIKKMQKHIIN